METNERDLPMKKILMLSAAAMVVSVSPVFAADATPPAATAPPAAEHSDAKRPHRNMLEDVDTNKDGDISKQEFMTGAEARFAKMDANSDGTISKQEIEALRAKFKEKMKERKAEMQKNKTAQ